MQVVKIKRHYAQYTPGDIAGFDDERADKLVEAGIAEVREPDSKESKVQAKAETSKPVAAKG